MGFFDDVPYQDLDARRRGDPWDWPLDEFPGAVATGPLVLAQTEEVAVAMSPLPPAGPVSFVCEWAAAGIPETRASLDAQLIVDAAGHSVWLWPGDGR
jgi:hypothetical protein